MAERSPIWQAVDKINKRLDDIEQRFDAPAVQDTPVTPRPEPVKSDFPVPKDFIDTVDLVLNKSFVVRCEPLRDSPCFQLTIVVPEKYSSMTQGQKEMLGEDIRPKVIPYSDGANGVRLWAEKVLNNLDKDAQFRVVQDRPFVERPM